MFNRIADSQFGPQMPLTGAMPAEEIELIRHWIDEGAIWPDQLANETKPSPPDARAVRVVDAIRRSDGAAARREIAAMPAVVNARGPAGATPLMYAALYGDTGLVGEMLKAGGDPNVRNDAGTNALMWGLESAAITRLLLERGADPNAASAFNRTPLAVAAMQARSDAVVELLLLRGSTATQAALSAAALHGRASVVQRLLAAGVRDNGDAALAALRYNCLDCFEAIAQAQELPPLTRGLLSVVPPASSANADAVREVLNRGADVTAMDQRSRSPLMLAAIVPGISHETVQLLVARGAPLDDTTPAGLTIADLATRSGNTRVAEVLGRAGAPSAGRPVTRPPTLVPAATPDEAIRRSLPLLQRTALRFYEKSGCVSCHHNSVAQMTVAAARARGIAVDESAARHDVSTMVTDIRATHDQAIQGIVVPGGWVTTTGYILMGLAAECQPADAATDALVRLLRTSQRSDGRWFSLYRPPIEASEFTATAVSLRGIQLYGSSRPGSSDSKAVRAAAAWLERAEPQDTEDRVFRLLGLTWARASARARDAARRDVVQTQRADGGWAQLASLPSDAYATGTALFALAEAGMKPDDPIYRRSVGFLLSTQLADGSWFVTTRTHPTQAYFESGSPHGEHQFISAAATNWATLALLRSLGAAR